MGRYPKSTERKKFGLKFTKRRYPTLKAFIDHAIQSGVITAQAKSATSLLPTSILDRYLIGPEEESNRLSAMNQIDKDMVVPPIPRETKRVKWERRGIEGFPYAPQDENGVVALFAILCSQGRIGWQVVSLNGGKGIDATCYDEATGAEIRVELKHTLSRAGWNHRIDDIDYVVCWENRWPDFPRQVVELRTFLSFRR